MDAQQRLLLEASQQVIAAVQAQQPSPQQPAKGKVGLTDFDTVLRI